MRKFIVAIFLLLSIIIGSSSCEKVLDIDLPEGASGIVFEGYIENGTFPYVIISRSESYFDPINTAATAIANALVRADSVFVTVDGVRNALQETCLADLPPEQQQLALEFLGLDALPSGFEICIFMKLDMTGELGKTYDMTAFVEGKEYNASTTINDLVFIDTLWYKDETPVDSFGAVWLSLTDPVPADHFYYLWTENLTQKRPMRAIDGGPSFEDRLFSGQNIEFNIRQGTSLASDNGSGEEYKWFQEGDTVVVKLATMDRGVYRFWESVTSATNLNPFSSPTPVFSNFDNGGRGVWAGYAATYDTVICVK